jgi:hypothetical protein
MNKIIDRICNAKYNKSATDATLVKPCRPITASDLSISIITEGMSGEYNFITNPKYQVLVKIDTIAFEQQVVDGSIIGNGSEQESNGFFFTIGVTQGDVGSTYYTTLNVNAGNTEGERKLN